MAIKVFISDDHQAIIDGLKNLMGHEKDLIYSGEARSETELKTKLKNKDIDVLLLDPFDYGKNFIKLVEYLSQEHTCMRILILSGEENLPFAHKTIKAGARGYVSKALRYKDIYETIRDIYHFPDQTPVKLTKTAPIDKSGPMVKELLTHRQIQVISLLCKGYKNNEEIADFLSHINKKHISAGSVQAHRRDIRAKLRDFGITNDASLGYWTAKWDLLDGSELSSSEDD